MIHSVMHRLHNPDLGLLVLRVGLGVVFIMHGYGLKLVNMPPTISFFASLGFPAWVAYFIAYLEIIGGALLIAGLFVRYVGLLLAVEMLVAVIHVHLKNGFFAPSGYEYAGLLMLGSLALALIGSGKYSVGKHAPICRECEVGGPSITLESGKGHVL